MIVDFRHKGLRQYWETGSKARIDPTHAKKLDRLLTILDEAIRPADLDLPGMHLHPLKGDLKGYYSVRITGNWRLTFRFDQQDVVDVDYTDYH